MMSIYPGVSWIYTPCRSVYLRYPCICVHPPSPLNDVHGGRDRVGLEMHLEAEIEWIERCTWRPWSSKLGDALGGQDQVNSETHTEVVIERVWRCNWRPRSGKLRDGLWGRDWARSEMNSEAENERTQWCTARLWSSEFGDALAGYDRVILQLYLKAVNLDGGANAAETLFLS